MRTLTLSTQVHVNALRRVTRGWTEADCSHLSANYIFYRRITSWLMKDGDWETLTENWGRKTIRDSHKVSKNKEGAWQNERRKERDKDNQWTRGGGEVVMTREGKKKKRLSTHFPVRAWASDWLDDLCANPLLALLATEWLMRKI